MNGVLTIAWREILSFFVSPIAYVVLTVWLLLQGLTMYFFAAFFASQQYQPGGATQTPLTLFFGGSTLFYLVLIVIASVLTMRLLAEEQRSGSIEGLLTSPVTEIQVVFGKYLAALTFWAALWLPTILYVVIVNQFGDVDWGIVAASYAGVMTVGLYYMAIGLLMSTVSQSQIVAAVLTFLLLGGMFVLGIGEFVLDGTAKEILGYVSVWGHMEDFAKGIVDSRHLVFSLSLTVLALFLAVKVLEGRRYG